VIGSVCCRDETYSGWVRGSTSGRRSCFRLTMRQDDNRALLAVSTKASDRPDSFHTSAARRQSRIVVRRCSTTAPIASTAPDYHNHAHLRRPTDHTPSTTSLAWSRTRQFRTSDLCPPTAIIECIHVTHATRSLYAHCRRTKALLREQRQSSPLADMRLRIPSHPPN